MSCTYTDFWYVLVSLTHTPRYVDHLVFPNSDVRGAIMGLTWVLSAPDGPHVGPMNLVIRVCTDTNCAVLVLGKNEWPSLMWLTNVIGCSMIAMKATVCVIRCRLFEMGRHKLLFLTHHKATRLAFERAVLVQMGPFIKRAIFYNTTYKIHHGEFKFSWVTLANCGCNVNDSMLPFGIIYNLK